MTTRPSESRPYWGLRASALTHAAEAHAEARGFDRIRETVSDANPAAQRV